MIWLFAETKCKKMKLKYFLIVVIVLSSLTSYAQEDEKKENPFSFKWDNGFKLQNQDKSFKMKFGGRIMVDHAFFFQDDAMDINFGELETTSGTEIRRARFYMSGTIYHNVEFKLQVDYVTGVTRIKDAYVGIKNVPDVGTIRVGNVKEPIRLDALTSSKYITFMERVLATDFAQERNSGILIFNDFLEKRLSAQAGVFRNANGSGNDRQANDGYVLTGRITGLIINRSEKKQLLHVGVGHSFRKTDAHEFSIFSRSEAHMGAKYINTGTMENIKHSNLTNFEAALVLNSFSFQGEYILGNYKKMDFDPIDNYQFSSIYGQVSYFITGESKNFKSSYSGFGRVNPSKNFGKNGSGAWEVAVRVSNSDLNSENIFGGEQTDITLGVNWYLNPVTRFMFNYVRVDIKDTGKVNVVQARVQIDF